MSSLLSAETPLGRLAFFAKLDGVELALQDVDLLSGAYLHDDPEAHGLEGCTAVLIKLSTAHCGGEMCFGVRWEGDPPSSYDTVGGERIWKCWAAGYHPKLY